MKTLSRIYLTLALLFGVVGLIQCVRWTHSSGTVSVGYLINFLPSIVFAVVYKVTAKTSRLLIHVAAIPLYLLACGIWGFVTLGMEMVTSATTEVTDVRKYDEILKNYWSSSPDLVSHFPNPIPSNAEEVRFSFLPGFLQGGAHVQLRYSSTARDISELYERFSAKKRKSFFGGDTNDHMNQTNGMPTTTFYTGPTNQFKFPDDYELMIFDPILTNGTAGFDWNHGQSHGVAISTNRHEIVYWAESW